MQFFSCTAARRGRDAAAAGTLSDEEKMHLRGKMMGLILLANNKLSIQVAVIFSKIARADYPAAWPTLFDDLINNLKDQEPGSLLTRCTLLILHHILKELASKRLVADQRRFEEISQRLIVFIWQHWGPGEQPQRRGRATGNTLLQVDAQHQNPAPHSRLRLWQVRGPALPAAAECCWLQSLFSMLLFVHSAQHGMQSIRRPR
jgi:hypothetical protein